MSRVKAKLTKSQYSEVAAIRERRKTEARGKIFCAVCLYRVGFGTRFIAKMLRCNKRLAIGAVKQTIGLQPGRIPLGHKPKDKAAEMDRRAWRDIKRRRSARKKDEARQSARRRRVERLARLASKRHKVRLRTFIWKVIAQRDKGTHCGSTNGECRRAIRKCRECFCLWLTGCKPSELREYIEKTFSLGMSFANYGDWEVDHVTPCAVFDLREERAARACFNYTNLQAMWRDQNRRKGARVGGGGREPYA